MTNLKKIVRVRTAELFAGAIVCAIRLPANGTEPFKGLLDCWRVSETALTRDEMLFRYPGGTILTVR